MQPNDRAWQRLGAVWAAGHACPIERRSVCQAGGRSGPKARLITPPPVTRACCLQLPAIGVGQEFISFKNTTMESDKYICVRETGAQNTVVIVDMANPLAPARRPITADSALMCVDKKVIALKATTPGVAGDTLQVFNLDTKQKLKTYQMPETVEFWKWITATSLGLVTASSVYHWDIDVRGGATRAVVGPARRLPCPQHASQRTPAA